MKEEIQRISRLVAEGKLSPEDGAELIEAFVAADKEAASQSTSHSSSSATPPPPREAKDPFKGLFENLEKGFGKVDWKEIGSQVEQGAKKGFEAIKSGIDDLAQGKVSFNPFTNEERREVRLPLNVPADKRLRIENPCGDVKVIGRTESGSVLAVAKLRGGTPEEAKARAQEYTVIVEESDALVVIRQPDVPGLSVDLIVRLPEASHVEVRTEAGDVDVSEHPVGVRVSTRAGSVKVRGAAGAVEVSADGGDIELEDVESPSVTLETKSGDLALSRVRGNVNARTAAGDIALTNSYGKVVALETVSGDLTLDLAEAIVGSVNVRTVSGDVAIDVPDGSDCRVTLSSLKGSVASSLPLEDEAVAEGRRTGRLGSGLGTLDVSAVTGDVQLRMRAATAV